MTTRPQQHILAGGNSNIFHVHPYLGKVSNLTHIFSNGLKPPTSIPNTPILKFCWGIMPISTSKHLLRLCHDWTPKKHTIQTPNLRSYLSHEKYHGWLGFYRGLYILPSYISGLQKTIIRIHINQPGLGMCCYHAVEAAPGKPSGVNDPRVVVVRP